MKEKGSTGSGRYRRLQWAFSGCRRGEGWEDSRYGSRRGRRSQCYRTQVVPMSVRWSDKAEATLRCRSKKSWRRSDCKLEALGRWSRLCFVQHSAVAALARDTCQWESRRVAVGMQTGGKGSCIGIIDCRRYAGRVQCWKWRNGSQPGTSTLKVPPDFGARGRYGTSRRSRQAFSD